MPNRKTTEETKVARGTMRNDRKNHNAPAGVGKIGPPPGHMSLTEQEAWKEILKKIPTGIATRADSFAFEVLVKLMVKLRTNTINGAEMTILMRSLSKFGLTPVDRDSVSVVAAKKKGRFDKYE